MGCVFKTTWRDNETGMFCRVVLTTMGHFCGYVGVEPGHPLFGMGYSEHVPELSEMLQEAMAGTVGDRGILAIAFADKNNASMDLVFDVHGSVTFAGKMDEDQVWWIGFDCAHYGDTNEIWNEEAVTKEVLRLAKQVAKVPAALTDQKER